MHAAQKPTTTKGSGVVRAVDTDVVVRYLLADEPRQAAAARRLVDRYPCWISLTVLLETE